MIQIKIIDEQHEQDCMDSANDFLMTLEEKDILDIRYSSSHFESGIDQVYSFSVCIIYRIED